MKIAQESTVLHSFSILDGATDPPTYRITCVGCDGIHDFQARSKDMAADYEWKCDACGSRVLLKKAIEVFENE